MTTFRERVTDWLLAGEKAKMQQTVNSLLEAAQYGPFRKPPQMLLEELQEYGSYWVQDLVAKAGYRIIGGLPYGSNLETLRTYALETSRYLWVTNPLYQWSVEVWANFGVGDGVSVVCRDPNANDFWQECFTGERNSNFYADDKTAENAETLEIEGNLFVVQFISTLDGTSTFSVIMDTDEIKEIVTDPNDRSIPLFYRRECLDASRLSSTIYYPNWSAYWADKLKNVTLPTGAKRSDEERADFQNGTNGTVALMHHISFNRKDRKSLWGWPLGAIAGSYLDSHKEFMENRLTVSRNKASYVRERTVKGGSRAVAAVRSALASSLMNSASTRETNPPPVAGSEDIHNDVITTKDLGMGTGASDARTDWEMFSHEALIGVGLFPVTAGMDTARWATALAMDKTQAMQWTRYQTFWASQFQAFVTMTLKAGEKWGGQKFETYDAQISIDTLSLVDFPDIVSSLSALIGTAITPMVAGGTMPNNTARVILRDLWKVALQALGVSNVDQITSDEIFEITPSEVKREYAGAMREFAELARRARNVLLAERYDPDQPRDDTGRFGLGGGSK